MGRYSVKEKVTPQVFDTVDFDSLVGGAEDFNLHQPRTAVMITRWVKKPQSAGFWGEEKSVLKSIRPNPFCFSKLRRSSSLQSSQFSIFLYYFRAFVMIHKIANR